MRTQEFPLWEPVTENFMMRRNFVVNMSSVDWSLTFLSSDVRWMCVLQAMEFVRDGSKFGSHQRRENMKTMRLIIGEKAKE